jgi:hypothetical protein
MKILGFYPDTIAARVRESPMTPQIPTLRQSLGVGAIGFGVIGAAMAAMVALGGERLQQRLGPATIDAVRAALFILLGGAVLSRLVIGPGRVLRFYIVFAVALCLHAAAWTLAYFQMHNDLGNWLGLFFGAVILGLTLATAFDAPRQLIRTVLVLFITRAAGFFGARFLHDLLPGSAGALMSSVLIAVGLGTGLGYALYACQEPVRRRLAPIGPAAAPPPPPSPAALP